MESKNTIILVIDDNTNNIKMIVDYLKKSGFETAVARNGLSGLKRAELLKPALILLDVLMPDMDGFETCLKLKANEKTKDIPVIFMTALTGMEEKVKAFSCGGVDYITKPAQREEVLARVNTHLKIREQAMELEAARKSAEQANKSKSEFLANMSHEIRTPMNAIVNMTRLLADSNLELQQQYYVKTILSSSDILLTLINDILDFSKIEAGKLDLECIDFNLREIVSDVINIIAMPATEKRLIMIHQIDHDVPIYLKGDPLRFRQIILNLVNNAVKFTEKGEIAIHISLDSSLKECQTENLANPECQTCSLACSLASPVFIRCSVTDTGIGISQEHIKRLFKTFSQSDSSTTRMYGGTGLGLAISKRLAEMMGGEIGIRSEVGIGSTFWFTAKFEAVNSEQLPVIMKKKFAAHSPTGIVSRSQAPVWKPEAVSPRILLVEDNKINQEVANEILNKFGCSADIADNGREAVKMLESEDYDLVLMDIQMPKVDGMQATKMIRDPESKVRNRNIPIIAMTANAMKDDRQQCIEAGMNDYVSKPIDMKELFSAIQRQLSGSSGQLSVSSEQLSGSSEQLSVSSEQLSGSSEQSSVSSEQSSVSSEQLSVNSHQSSVSSEQLSVNSHQSSVSSNKMITDNCLLITDNNVFDWQEFLERMGGNKIFCDSLMKQISVSLKDETEKLKTYLNNNDVKKVIIQAHNIKGMASNISARRLSDAAREIELSAKADDLNRAGLLIKNLEKEVKTFLSVLNEFF